MFFLFLGYHEFVKQMVLFKKSCIARNEINYQSGLQKSEGYQGCRLRIWLFLWFSYMDTPKNHPNLNLTIPRNLFRKKTWQDWFVCFSMVMKGSLHLIQGVVQPSIWPRAFRWVDWALVERFYNRQEVINEVFPWTPKPKTMKNDGFKPRTNGLLPIKLKVVSSHGSCIYFGMFRLSSWKYIRYRYHLPRGCTK